NLNEAQKKAAKAAVDAETDPSKVQGHVTDAANTDTAMKNLAEDSNLANVDEIEKGVNFTNADKNLQNDFKQAVKDAKDLLDKANGAAKNAEEVKAVQNAIKDALDKLNGNQKLADAKDKAKQTVDNLPNLNEAQKKAAKAAVDAETDPGKVQGHVTDATNTDTAMKNLAGDKNLAKADEIEKGVNFTNADKDLQDKFKQAVQDAKDLLDKAKGAAKNAEEVKAVQNAIDQAKDNLNGKETDKSGL
ncbi:hypothetical protein B6U59_10490, partial [Ligilactobacillus salivarius]